jgi:hypothetical protein
MNTPGVESSSETLWSILRGVWTPQPSNAGPVVQSDAPGTSDRDMEREGSDYARDVPAHSRAPKIPDSWKRNRSSGPGPSGTIGYRNHGDAVRVATRIDERQNATRARFPELLTHGRPFTPPAFNVLYDIFKTCDAYDKCVLFTAHGNFAAGNTAVSTPLTMDPASIVVGASQSPLSHLQLLNQFPGALQMLPVLLTFSFGQSVVTATGEFSLTFIPQGGDVAYPLGEYYAGTGSVQNTMRHIIKAPITDPGQVALGTLLYTPNTVAGITGTLYFRIGFGMALLLPTPAFKLPEPLQVGQWITASPEPPEQQLPRHEELVPEALARHDR